MNLPIDFDGTGVEPIRTHGISGRLLAITLAVLALGVSASSSVASDLPWVSTAVRGTVIYLAGDRWEEVAKDQDLATAQVRTLRSGYLSAAASGLVLEIGPSSVLELGSSEAPDHFQVRHYVGTMTVSALAGPPAAVAIQAGRVLVTSIQGELQISVTSESTTLAVHSGSVQVRGTGGTVSVMTAGTYVTTDDGVLFAMAETPSGGGAAGSGRDVLALKGDSSAGAGHDNSADASGNGQAANNGNGPEANNGNGPDANNGNGPDANNGNGPEANNGNGPDANNGNGPDTNNGNGPGANSGNGNGNAGGNGGKKKEVDGGTDVELPTP